MLFSFVKELDDRSAKLLKSLNDKQRGWQSNPRVVVWAFWIGDDANKAKQWAVEHKINNIVFGVTTKEELAHWKIHDMASNVLVIACRRKTAMATFTDLEARDIEKLELRLISLVGGKRRD